MRDLVDVCAADDGCAVVHYHQLRVHIDHEPAVLAYF